MNKLNIVILAAGKGTRMHSDIPKVLHKVGGKSILGHVIDCAKNIGAQKIVVVYGYGGQEVRATINDEEIIWVDQPQQKGTGHAVQQAISHLDNDACTLILLGDVPLVDVEACKKLVSLADSRLAILTFNKTDPSGYGRIIRDSKDRISAIIEHKDASSLQREITEVNTGIMALSNAYLKTWLAQLNNNTAQGEYYLTDIVKIAEEQNVGVVAEITKDEWSVTGINSKKDLSQKCSCLTSLGEVATTLT